MHARPMHPVTVGARGRPLVTVGAWGARYQELLAETQLSSAQAEILHAGPEVLRRLAQCGAGRGEP